MTKRIQLTVEWQGAASEQVWGSELRRIVEEADASGRTRVVEIDHLTTVGETTPLPESITLRRRLREMRSRG